MCLLHVTMKTSLEAYRLIFEEASKTLPNTIQLLTTTTHTNICSKIHLGDRMGKNRDIFKKIRDTQGTFHGEGDGTPLQYSCLENPMDGEVHGVAKSWTQLRNFTFTFHFHALEKEMATHSTVLAWRIPGMGEPGGCRLWGHTESDTTEVT